MTEFIVIYKSKILYDNKGKKKWTCMKNTKGKCIAYTHEEAKLISARKANDGYSVFIKRIK